MVVVVDMGATSRRTLSRRACAERAARYSNGTNGINFKLSVARFARLSTRLDFARYFGERRRRPCFLPCLDWLGANRALSTLISIERYRKLLF